MIIIIWRWLRRGALVVAGVSEVVDISTTVRQNGYLGPLLRSKRKSESRLVVVQASVHYAKGKNETNQYVYNKVRISETGAGPKPGK